MRRLLTAVVLSLFALPGCGGDDGAPTDADVRDFDAPVVDAAAIDGSAIDAATTDARVIDAMPDTPGPAAVNGCTEAGAVDRTAAGAAREVVFADFEYTPACMRIRAGQTVTWNGSFASHPLRGGLIVNGVRTAQAGNPVPAVNAGTTASVTFPAAGAWGYYCNFHFGAGMMGAVYVVP